MALVVGSIYKFYTKCFSELNDKRLDFLPFVGSPTSTCILLACYLYGSLIWGPRFMKDRKPYNIKSIIVVYNVAQVVLNAFIAVYFFYHSYFQSDFSLKCQPCFYGTSDRELIIAQATYFYFLLKIFNLLDTLFFILRKKLHLVTFLHVYHHTMMISTSFVAANFLPGGHSTMVAVLNSWVHVFMYSYYLVTLLSDKLNTIWWKKYITQIQMAQFLLVWIHYTNGLIFGCSYPKLALLAGFIQSFFMLAMFSDYYYHEYIKKKKVVKE